MSEYAERNPMELEPHYSKHVQAMTSENLFSKSDIAAELAFRDKQIEEMDKEFQELHYKLVKSESHNVNLTHHYKGKIAELESKLKQVHKDLGCELRDPYGTIWEHASKLESRVAELEEVARQAAELDTGQGCDPAHHRLVIDAIEALSQTSNPEQKDETHWTEEHGTTDGGGC